MSINLRKSESTEEESPIHQENIEETKIIYGKNKNNIDNIVNLYDGDNFGYSEDSGTYSEGSENYSEGSEYSDNYSDSYFNEEDQAYLDDLLSESDSDLKIVLKFGYLVNIDGNEEIRLKIENEEVIDIGLIAGLTQGEDLVDAFFTGNIKMKDEKSNIIFEKDCIKANNKEYKYDNIKIQMSSDDVFVVSDDDDVILKIDKQVHDMFSSVLDSNQDNTCVISVVKSKVSAAYVCDGEVLWIKQIELGKNSFNEDKSEITTKKKQIISLDDCYLRACKKYIYLHVDVINPERTLILGKADNPFNEESLEEEEWETEEEDFLPEKESKEENLEAM